MKFHWSYWVSAAIVLLGSGCGEVPSGAHGASGPTERSSSSSTSGGPASSSAGGSATVAATSGAGGTAETSGAGGSSSTTSVFVLGADEVVYHDPSHQISQALDMIVHDGDLVACFGSWSNGSWNVQDP